MKKILFTLAIVFCANLLTYAQDGWNWPEDPDKKRIAMEKNAFYSDMVKSENYEDAKPAVVWLMKNTPDLNASIYIQGAKIFENLAETTSGQEKKNMQDSTVLIYDLRMKYFNDKKNVTNRQAIAAYEVWRDRRDKFKELYKLEKEAFELLGNDISIGATVAFMDATRRYKAIGGDVSDVEVIENYEKITDLFDQKLKEGKDAKLVNKFAGIVEKVFTATVDVDCDLIDDTLYPKFIKNGKTLEDAEQIVSFALAGSCTSSPSFIDAAKVVVEEKPEFGLLKYIAIKSKSNENYDDAISYYERALEQTEDNVKQAEVYLDMADIKSKQGLRSEARSYAYKALEADPSRKEAYILIGDLYLKSNAVCKGGKDMVIDRSIYIAAYNMYMKGGDQKRAAIAKEQFPSKEEVFTFGHEIGEEINTGCWIGESVVVRTRD